MLIKVYPDLDPLELPLVPLRGISRRDDKGGEKTLILSLNLRPPRRTDQDDKVLSVFVSIGSDIAFSLFAAIRNGNAAAWIAALIR